MQKHTLQSFGPSNGELLGEVPITPTAQIKQQVQQAKQAAKSWRQLGLEKRAKMLEQTYEQAQPHMQALVVLLSVRWGKIFAVPLVKFRGR